MINKLIAAILTFFFLCSGPGTELSNAQPGLRATFISAPRAKVSVSDRVATFYIKESSRVNRNYFIVIKYADSRKRYTRRKITARRGAGALTLKNIPVGNFVFYTEATTRRGVRKTSVSSRFKIVSARLVPTSTPQLTSTPRSAVPTATSTNTPTPTPTISPTLTPTVTPTPIFSQLTAGYLNNCAVLSSGALRCWGSGSNGANGYSNTDDIGDDELPRTAGDLQMGRLISKASVGSYHVCAIGSGNVVQCWGYGEDGRLGYANTNSIGNDETPASAGAVNLGAGISATSISSGEAHTCALLNTANVMCWGLNDHGQLGYGNTNSIGDDETPASAGTLDLGGNAITQISSGTRHTCAISNSGNVYCWGENDHGKLGYSNTNAIGDNEMPVSVGAVDLGANQAVQLALGGSHTCALLSSGSVMCWGYGGEGQIGYGNTNTIGDNETPAAAGVINLGAGIVVQIAAGFNHTCALLDSGRVRCWGSNTSGQLGYGNTNNIGDDESAGAGGDLDIGGNVKQISAGGNHTCVLLTDDSIRCWGVGLFGVLGYGNTDSIGDDETPQSAGPVIVAD
jgi:alpha-tubulin suppressor-like RCC1 family protein